jgi:hypothetical protein
MIDKIFYRHIRTTCPPSGEFRFGSAEGSVPPYVIMYKISDSEQPEILCAEQGYAGRALFQFSAYTGGSDGDAADAGNVVDYLQDLKKNVALIKGVIGIAPSQARIWQNVTTGVVLIGNQGPLGAWGAMFETVLRWEYI